MQPQAIAERTQTDYLAGLKVTEKQFSPDAAPALCPELGAFLSFMNADPLTLSEARERFSTCHFHLVDVTSENPMGYQVTDYDDRSRMDEGTDYNGLIIGNYTNSMVRGLMADAMATSAKFFTPRFSLVTKHGLRSYFHLVYPLHFSGNVSQLMIGARYHEFGLKPRLVHEMAAGHMDKIGGNIAPRGREKFCAIKTQIRTRKPIGVKWQTTALKVAECMADLPLDIFLNGD